MFETVGRNKLFLMMNAANYLGISRFIWSASLFIAEKLQKMEVRVFKLK